MLETLQKLDQELFLYLNDLHSHYGDAFMYIYTSKLVWVPMYASILYVLCKNFNLRMVAFTTIAFALVITLADQSCSSVLRPIFERPRPSRNPEIADIVHLVNNRRGGMYGFPSCHAANTFALTFFIMWLFKNKILTLFFAAWATITCYSRIYVGVHYPGDLLFGTLVGFMVATLVYSIYRYMLQQEKIAHWLHYHAGDASSTTPHAIKHSQIIIQVGLWTIIIFAIYCLFV